VSGYSIDLNPPLIFPFYDLLNILKAFPGKNQ